jgi:prephenate dehydratase
MNSGVAYFGSRGSFGEEAARRFAAERCPGADLHPCRTPREALALLARGEAHFAVLPVANSSTGLVPAVLEALAEHPCGFECEVSVSVRLTLWGRAADLRLLDLTGIASHPQALRQCRHTLTRLFGTYREIEWSDTAEAARALATGDLGGEVGVLASATAGEAAGLVPLVRDVHDEPNNRTFFAVLRRFAADRLE